MFFLVFQLIGIPEIIYIREAYRFAKGDKITNGFGSEMQLKEPLDFYAVTDHGMWLGVVPEYADPESKLGQLEGTRPFHNINSPVYS